MKQNYYFPTVVLSFILVFSSCSAKKTETKKPNILFIIADDLGYYDLSCQGSKYYETPNIDGISKEGMTFTNGYAACQVCSPSRASIMTGEFPARHGITDWIGAPTGEDWRKHGRHSMLLPPEYEHKLKAEHTTLPEALKGAGYKTFFAGKWHLGSKGSWPTDHGFDINIGGWHAGSPAGGYFSPYKNPNLENRKDGENLSMRLANETVKFMKENRDTAFFAFLSFYAVHSPIQTTREKWEKYRKKAIEAGVVPTGYKMEHFLPIRQEQDNPVYGGLVEAMDDAVGVVLKALRELGLDQNTIVIFTSDNGGVASGDAFSTSNLPLRGGKGYQWEAGIREPYFIKIPWMPVAGKTCDAPVSGVDFYPTVLDLANVDVPVDEAADGVSLVPLLKGENIPERQLIWHYPHYGNQGGEPSSIIRKGKWKLIHYYEDDHEELYDLDIDKEEKTNLASGNPEKVNELSTQLFSYLKDVGAKYPVKDPEYDMEAEKNYLEQIRNKRLPQLEKQRKRMLSEDFNPGNDWWGSKVTKD